MINPKMLYQRVVKLAWTLARSDQSVIVHTERITNTDQMFTVNWASVAAHCVVCPIPIPDHFRFIFVILVISCLVFESAGLLQFLFIAYLLRPFHK